MMELPLQPVQQENIRQNRQSAKTGAVYAEVVKRRTIPQTLGVTHGNLTYREEIAV